MDNSGKAVGLFTHARRLLLAVLTAVALVCSACLPVGPTTTAQSPATPLIAGAASEPVVRFVYFVERDAVYSPVHLRALRDQAVDLQRFWFEQFGTTFSLSSPVVDVVFGDQEVAWYETTITAHEEVRFWRGQNIWDEVAAKLSLAPRSIDTKVIVFPHSGPDAQIGVFDSVAGRGGGAAVMDVDDIWCAAGTAPSFPYPEASADCLALLAHELGHIFGLDHEGPFADCMQFGFYDHEKRCEFSDDLVRQVLGSEHAPALGRLPGDVLGGRFTIASS